MPRKHVLAATDLTPAELLQIFKRAESFKRGEAFVPPLTGRILASIFYEPSTRTRFSFESAMLRLGGQCISTENADMFSSIVKGESLEDAARVMSGYADIIVFRHKENGSARKAATAAEVPVINGGDGTNEHPTQAYLDLFTIWEATRGRFESNEVRILFFGDNLHSRTVNSLARLLATHAKQVGIKVLQASFTGTSDFGKPQSKTIDDLTRSGIEVDTWEQDAPQDFNVVYVTRSQKERHSENGGEILVFAPGPELRSDAIILHPLPRNEELPVALDADHRAWYFRQANNGLYVRMALLEFLLK
jgi:aspartate carbamoyltransferase catalytic subunit